MKKSLNIFFLLTFFCIPLISRASTVDSLETLAGTLPDSLRAEKYIEWTRTLEPADAVAIGRRGISWAIDRQEKKTACELLLYTGRAYFILGDYVLALDCYHKAMIVTEMTGDKQLAGMVHTAIGQLYSKRKEPVQAEAEYMLALGIFAAEKDTYNLATIYNYLGNLYEDAKQEPDRALQYYYKSVSLSRPVGDSVGVAYSLDFIAGVYSKQGKYEEALRLLNDELRIRRWSNDRFGEAINVNNIGEVYKMKGDIRQAETYFLEALEMAKKLDYKDFMVHIYTQLSEISRDRDDFANAYGYMELKSAVKDSLISEKKNYQIAEIREKYESDKKEQQILTLNKEKELGHQREVNLRNYFITAVLVLILGGVIGWLYYNQQQQRKLLAERIIQEQLRTRAIIEAEEKERVRIARELHDGVGQLLAAARMNLAAGQGEEKLRKETASRLVDDAIREVRSVSHSMMPDVLVKHGLAKALKDLVEKINQAGKPEIQLHLNGWEERWEPAQESVLYRVSQELLTNILKHSDATKVNIDLNKFDDEINLIVEDNGKGFDPGNLPEGSGIGLKNMQSRITFLGGHMIIDAVPGRGVTTIIAIPVNEKKHEV